MKRIASSRALTEDMQWGLRVAMGYIVTPNITYFKANNFEAKLDVYQPCKSSGPRPTFLFMHAGAWKDTASKETWALWCLPFLHLGWVVVNVDYRPSSVALAPAAVEDCLRALLWVGENTHRYGMDPKQLVIAGLSAGSHLALTTGMISQSVSGAPEAHVAGERPVCASGLVLPSGKFLKPAAIVNWCGITDVAEIAEGPARQEYAVAWLGDRVDRITTAKAVSPLSYVHAGVPPVVSIHGDKDQIVPYSQAVRLHKALSQAGVTNKLITAHGADHGFSLDSAMNAYPQILDFLAQQGVTIHPE